MGNPPALLEDPRSLTAPGVAHSLQIVNCLRFTKGDLNAWLGDSEAHHMGMQISCGLHSEMSSKDIVWAVATRLGAGLSGLGRAEGMRGN